MLIKSAIYSVITVQIVVPILNKYIKMGVNGLIVPFFVLL